MRADFSKGVQGGYLLRKMPLESLLSDYSNSENAIVSLHRVIL
jgi:hypothetical protein